MSFSYKDLTYIRASIQAYDGMLSEVDENECADEDEFAEVQDDRLYLNRLLALVDKEITNIEGGRPNLTSVKK